MGEVLQEKLLKESADGAGTDADEDVVDGDLSIVPIAVWIVETGDASGCEVSKDVGVVWLPVAAVAFADENGCDGVEGS